MKKLSISDVLLSLTLLAPASNATESRFFEVWQCSLREGATMEAITKANARWLRFVNKALPKARITTGTVTAVVGDYTSFSIIDSYPDMQVWAKTKKALETDEGKVAGGGLDGVLDCTGNTLQNYVPSE
jgi:hypothetical protein